MRWYTGASPVSSTITGVYAHPVKLETDMSVSFLNCKHKRMQHVLLLANMIDIWYNYYAINVNLAEKFCE